MNSKEEFTVQMKRKVAEIEEILKEYLPKPEGYQKVIMEAMEYSLMAGGKRLRPMLMRETSRLFGDETEALCPFMAALEMIHTYSLVHDDLPAMDNDEYRRGRKTTHIVYGEDMGILAGDALLNYAFETAFRAFETAPQESLKIGRALSVLGRKAGVYGMIGGQVIDVKETGHAVPKDVLDTIYELKTGALIECAMMIGAILGGAEEEDVRKVEKIAHYVGIAFQIQDDILDVTSTEEVLGKPIHSDEKNQKTKQNDCRVKAEVAQSEYAGIQQQIKEKKRGLPYGTATKANEAIQQKQKDKKQLEDAIEDAGKEYQKTQNELTGVRANISLLSDELRDAPENDLKQLEQEEADAERALADATAEKNENYSRWQNNGKQQKTLRRKAEDAVRIEREYRMMQNVADTAKGDVTGKPNISLETYVQMEYFDRIIRHANLRLLHMSRGQYELKRRQLLEKGTVGEVGLDLDVIDHYNGSIREVGTLSGGESFLAALSLALGMSDMVQASAASAVRLDTMFVDEGFGSLSGNFLELAMNELIDTAENGHRLIGIISHVEEVKGRIPHRIEVTKGRTGGSAAQIR